jgi:hypothetical protein
MKQEAALEIARDKEIKERIRAEKIQKDLKYRMPLEPVAKSKRITKRKPKIKPKKIISKEKLKAIEMRKQVKSKDVKSKDSGSKKSDKKKASKGKKK